MERKNLYFESALDAFDHMVSEWPQGRGKPGDFHTAIVRRKGGYKTGGKRLVPLRENGALAMLKKYGDGRYETLVRYKETAQ